MGVASRLILGVAIGVLLAGGALEMDPRAFLGFFVVNLLYGIFVWRASDRAGVELDWLNLIFDTAVMVLLLRLSGGAVSPLGFMVYLWFFSMLLANVQSGDPRSLAFMAVIGWLVFALGSGGREWPRVMAVNSVGLGLFAFGALVLLDERRLGRLDPLTRVLNRGAGLECLAEKMRRREGFELAFIDLKNFKAVNDAYGHAVGDQVLRVLAGRLLASVRGRDLVIRYGGDEFLVAASGSGLQKRLRRVFATPLSVFGRRVVVQGDVGLVHWRPEDGLSLQELLDRADAAMYRMKYTGVREDH